MGQLCDSKQIIVTLQQFPACDVGIVEIKDGGCLMNEHIEQAEYGIKVCIIIVKNPPEKLDDFY